METHSLPDSRTSPPGQREGLRDAPSPNKSRAGPSRLAAAKAGGLAGEEDRCVCPDAPQPHDDSATRSLHSSAIPRSLAGCVTLAAAFVIAGNASHSLHLAI
ncbi:hypothetical protein NQZ68_035258 [Dissostichus eleginoides]|nr:hypothetical protein NQZ68_035258 [Dissostichus eleginoides]